MRAALVLALALGFAVGTAQGQTVFPFSMDGSQAGTPSTFTGSGTVTLNQAQNQITVAFTHNIPNGNVTMGHIHQGAVGVSGGIIFPFAGNGVSPTTGETFAISPAQVATLQAGNYYVNIHTIAFSGGEIRGQVLPPVDTDQDLLLDEVETNTGTFVNSADTGTNPNDPDTDNDGVMDGIEVQLGTDPNDALDFPSLPVNPAWLLAVAAGLAVIGVGTVVWRRRRKT